VPSLLFSISYLGHGVPAVAAGILAVCGPGLIGAAECYDTALVPLGVLALSALLRAERKERKSA
jgi:hypothetical protein